MAAVVAVGFGLATIFAGGRVLLGSDPGYVVFRPLLVFNTVMGLVYVLAGIAIWRNVVRGRQAAGAIFAINFLVLLAISLLYVNGSAVAMESLRAMTLRTGIWLVLFFILFRIHRTPDDLSTSTPR